MKRTMALVAIIMLLAVPVFAESSGTGIINHNEISGAYYIGKKLIKTEKSVTTGSIGVTKTVLVNAFGDEFDPVPADKGWGAVLEFRTLFE